MADYTGWIIALVVLGMVAYPILQIVPSKRQKLLIELRQYAARQGIKVNIVTPQIPEAMANQYHDLKICAAYSLIFAPDQESSFKQTCIALRSASQENEWFWLNNERPPAALLAPLLEVYQALPDSCLAVEQSPAGCSLYWKEHGNTENVDDLLDYLKQLNSLAGQSKKSLF